MSVDPSQFRALLSRFASSVTVVSARDESGADRGMTVSAFSSVSLEPPLVLMCVDQSATLHELLQRTDMVGVSVLAREQEWISRHFATRERHEWEGVPQRRGICGVPLVDGAIAHLECRVVARHRAGDHTIVVAQVERGDVAEGDPLLYFRGEYAGLRR